jgi:hypothetical protein
MRIQQIEQVLVPFSAAGNGCEIGPTRRFAEKEKKEKEKEKEKEKAPAKRGRLPAKSDTKPPAKKQPGPKSDQKKLAENQQSQVEALRRMISGATKRHKLELENVQAAARQRFQNEMQVSAPTPSAAGGREGGRVDGAPPVPLPVSLRRAPVDADSTTLLPLLVTCSY